MKIHLTLPLPPNRANAREHWRVTHRKKKVYYGTMDGVMVGAMPDGTKITLVRTAPHGALRPRLTQPEQRRMHLAATFYVWAKMDQGNAVARLKWIEDALVHFGLLKDDSEEWLGLEIPKQVIDRKRQRVEIVLTEGGDNLE